MSINYSLISEEKQKALSQLLWIGIGSICMFFGGLTSYVIAEGSSISFNIPDWFSYSTWVIFFSSVLLIFAKINLKKNKPIFIWVFSVFLLGILFTFFQFKGWQELTMNNVFFTGKKSSPIESIFFVLTAAHLVHLLAGVIVLLVTSLQAKKGKYTVNDSLGLNLASTYWHFLAILWLYLFCFLTYL